MKTTFPQLSQTAKNSTIWIGHLASDPQDHLAGQTFTCTEDGTLDNIQVFASEVHHPGEVLLSFHFFNEENKTWGEALAQSSLVVRREDTSTWIQFQLPLVELKKESVYGFRLQTNQGMIALGEAVTNLHAPFRGHEWNAETPNDKGNYFAYFSLAYKIEIRA